MAEAAAMEIACASVRRAEEDLVVIANDRGARAELTGR
jgi:hypothetical protein